MRIKTRRTAAAALAVVTGTMTGCTLVNPQAGPLGFGHDDPWGTDNYCAPDAYLEEPYFLGERVRNLTDAPITLTGIELVNPTGIELVAAGVAPVNPDADGFMGGNRELADPAMPWPQMSAEPLQYTLSHGEQINLIVQIKTNGRARPATVDRLKIRYESGNWEYTEYSGTSLKWVPTASC
ncbi:hypothetical protein [Citricoccus sp.]|uniref:hypothetical protein n=1 Tax=Citricoccus sp. TaxID=1978372 RepID=UPI002BFC023A|nr:hypothetical protein [Citricoccus sp.]HRO93216.1 hypothetical protein [Citricoccus sp.]